MEIAVGSGAGHCGTRIDSEISVRPVCDEENDTKAGINKFSKNVGAVSKF